MLQEPIEERYNEVLRQRIALVGEMAILRQQHKEELQKAQKSPYRFLYILLILPLTTFLCGKKIDPSVYERQIATQRDSITQLQSEMLLLEKTKLKQIKYAIRDGDDLSKIGILFFNDMKAAYQIGQDNGLYSDYQHQHLHPGDTLVINFR
jgi:hypothetical protein